MKTNSNNWTMFILLIVMQILICNFVNVGPYLLLSILPAVILCLPMSCGTVLSMAAAFLAGLSVDWLSEGLLGINAFALVPVGLARKTVIRIFLGEAHIVRQEGFSIRKNGILKVSAAVLVSLMIFLTFYIIADSAGSRSALFIAGRILASLPVCYILSMITVNLLTASDKRQESSR